MPAESDRPQRKSTSTHVAGISATVWTENYIAVSNYYESHSQVLITLLFIISTSGRKQDEIAEHGEIAGNNQCVHEGNA